MGKISKDNDGNLIFKSDSFGSAGDTYLGKVLQEEDGFYNFYPEGSGYYSSFLLSLIVSYLENLNEEHIAKIDEFLSNLPPDDYGIKLNQDNNWEPDNNGQF